MTNKRIIAVLEDIVNYASKPTKRELTIIRVEGNEITYERSSRGLSSIYQQNKLPRIYSGQTNEELVQQVIDAVNFPESTAIRILEQADNTR